MPLARGGAKGAYAPPPFARDACRRPSTQPARACARGRTRDSRPCILFLHAIDKCSTRGSCRVVLREVHPNLTLCSPEYYHHCHYVYNHPLRSFYYPLNIQCSYSPLCQRKHPPPLWALATGLNYMHACMHAALASAEKVQRRYDVPFHLLTYVTHYFPRAQHSRCSNADFHCSRGLPLHAVADFHYATSIV